MTFLTMLSVILLSMLMILLSILSVISHLICGNNLNWLLNLNLIYETLWTGVRSGLLISMLRKLSWFRLTGLTTMALLMRKWMGLFLSKKSSFKMLGLTFSSELDWGCYIISIAKTASKKIGALIRSTFLSKFLSSEVSLYLCKSTIRPCMEYCFHVWDKLQKQICRTVGPSLAISLEPLAHRLNVAS